MGHRPTFFKSQSNSHSNDKQSSRSQLRIQSVFKLKSLLCGFKHLRWSPLKLLGMIMFFPQFVIIFNPGNFSNWVQKCLRDLNALLIPSFHPEALSDSRFCKREPHPLHHCLFPHCALVLLYSISHYLQYVAYNRIYLFLLFDSVFPLECKLLQGVDFVCCYIPRT